MRKTFCASVLVLVLCGSVSAGDITNPPIAPGDITNPPRASQSTGIQINDGSTDTGVSATMAESTLGNDAENFAAIALSVINSVLVLL